MTPVAGGWENFFVAEVSAAAALSGLLFVAVSINLTRILAITHLPGRAIEALIVLLSVLFIATFGLVPRQGHVAFGAEVIATGLFSWVSTVRTQLPARRNPEARQWLFIRVCATQMASVPFLVAGGLIMAGVDAGLYWLVPGTIASFAAGVLNALVLLVEIQR
jgi:hypothetical protein